MSAPIPRQDTPRRQSSFNRCNLPPWVIASVDFQDNPRDLELDGVRNADRKLFDRLAALPSPSERARVFHDYVTVKFRLHEWAEHNDSARASLRNSYVQFIHGWGADSNGHSGAVLKSWVESRFGLPATYHTGLLSRDPAACERYTIDRMRGAARTVAVAMQLDLLYTFCQDELRRRNPDTESLTLYRGTHDPEEYTIGADPGGGQNLVALNNLSSFTSDAEIAWEFGSSVWEVRVPLAKIIFFSGLLPPQLLGGEAEFLILGGDYRVKTLRW